jgi:biotin operon repressor
MPVRWTQECDYVLTKNWATKTQIEIAKMLNCDEATVARHVKQLRAIGIDLPDKRYKPAPVPLLQPAPLPKKETPFSWPDNWRISPPTKAQLMGRR